MKPSVDRDSLIAQIEKAFSGVRLDDGIGLKEGQAIDDRENLEVRQIYRAEDEKEEWNCIPADMLNSCYSSLSFFDSKGMRFHLPAFLLAHLRGLSGWDPVFHLTHLSDYSKRQLELLSDDQRKAIESYLCFLLDDRNFSFERNTIESALKNYWRNNAR